MTSRATLAILALLSQTGCVAAIPMAAQLVTGANSVGQLCSMATMPGQTASLCDRLPFGGALQSPVASAVPPAQGASRGTIVNAAAK
jgi:hypothetical protein